MRRRIGFLVAALLVAAPAGAANVAGLAAPVGPGKFTVSGFVAYGEQDVEDGRADEVSTRRMLGRVQVGVVDGLDLYGFLGFSDIQFQEADFEGTLGGLGGVGAKIGVLRSGDVRVVVDLQAEFDRSEDGSRRVRHQAYHLAGYVVREIGAAGTVGYMYPYAGLRFTASRYDGGGLDDYRQDGFLGVFGGADYFVNPNVYFTGEVHLFDETSIYIGVGHRF
ncbi:hypothetical protein [Deferrisoma camini]|uniref:hypothetical protein n=1 Tax=Deferrisoma camini TaxID=1035120 RepID=UPI00046D5FFD|nr:hypothetical protein [Deferrisoma camini]